MKKHHVNHPFPQCKPRDARRQPKAAKGAVVGIAMGAALAVSSMPTPSGRQVDSISVAYSPLAIDAAAYRQPVELSLLSGIDAIAWDTENITSAGAGMSVADASDPGSALDLIGAPEQFAGQLVGQKVGALGVLPGGLQLIHPVSSRHITSPYGWRNNPTGPGSQIHIGQDYAIPCGSPVYATADGVVVQSAWAGHSGLRVTIDHGSSVRTGYSHNSRLIAKVGDSVSQGQLIALSGTTGNSTGCHVHYEVIINGRWNDPRNFLPLIPGQPNPSIDSRRTTIAAEPIRDSGESRTESPNGHDIEVELPKPSTAPPKATVPASESPRSNPSEVVKPEAKPDTRPSPESTRSPTPAPTPSDTPLPTKSPTPSPTKTPAPESSPSTEQSGESTAPSDSPPTTISPTVSPSTISPTVSPSTISPTVSPSTISPTVSPSTISPTVSPSTISPTVSPSTISPTVSPSTISPTVSPSTISPTVSPSTISPTVSPSTISPTVSPSTDQSESPTTKLSELPGSMPGTPSTNSPSGMSAELDGNGAQSSSTTVAEPT